MFQLQEPMTEEEIEELIADFLEVEGKVIVFSHIVTVAHFRNHT